MSPEIYGNLIIGSAEGGKFLAGHLASSGQKTAIIERRSIGGQAVIPAAGHRASRRAFGLPGFPHPVEVATSSPSPPITNPDNAAFKSRALDRCSLSPKYL
jgi:hypothetical protein